MGNVHTSHYEIFDYWKNKRVTSSGEVIDGCPQGEAPALVWLSFPICFAYLAIKSAIKKNRSKRTYDEFDWWQDQQGDEYYEKEKRR